MGFARMPAEQNGRAVHRRKHWLTLSMLCGNSVV